MKIETVEIKVSVNVVQSGGDAACYRKQQKVLLCVVEKKLLLWDFRGEKGECVRVCNKFLCSYKQADTAGSAIHTACNGHTQTSLLLASPRHFHRYACHAASRLLNGNVPLVWEDPLD